MPTKVSSADRSDRQTFCDESTVMLVLKNVINVYMAIKDFYIIIAAL